MLVDAAGTSFKEFRGPYRLEIKSTSLISAYLESYLRYPFVRHRAPAFEVTLQVHDQQSPHPTSIQLMTL